MKDQTKILEAGRLRQSLTANMPQTWCAWTVEDDNLRLGGTDESLEQGRNRSGSSILQRNSPISLIWLQWETAWLAALLLLLLLL